VKILCNLGYLTGRRGLIAESMGYFRKALELYPDYDEALRGYGKRLYDLKRYEESAQYYSRAVSVSPKNADCRNDYGIVLEKIGRYDEAEAHFTVSIRLNPSNPVPYQEMSNIMIAKEEFRKALDFLHQAAALGGDPRIILNNSAVAEFLSGNLSGAYELLLRAESQDIVINEDLARTIRASLHQR
jgi:Tfp pilus assembly protein PilF